MSEGSPAGSRITIFDAKIFGNGNLNISMVLRFRAIKIGSAK
jgi:hypothetical protein